MSNIEERVKSIVVKQLGVKEEEIKNESKLLTILVQILLIQSNLLWL